jgi:C4-dicarboxylate-specific signal transduction histidine kinase
MENNADEIKYLQGCINDLISVLALSALWSGREPSEMIRALLDGLLGMQRLDFVYARLSETIDVEPIEMVRWAQRYDRDVQAHEVGRALDRWLTGDLSVSPLAIANPVGEGEVAIAAFRLGLQDHLGVLVAGSARRDFPTQVERLLLRVAANQAAIGLQEARLLSAQKRAAKELEQRVAERTRQLSDVNEELRQEISERQRAEAEALALKDELAAELSGMTRLHEFSTRLLASIELQPLLDEVLDAIMALQNADFGLIQLYNPDTQALEIVAQRGFRADFLEYFSSVHEDSSACGRAMQRKERVIIEDVELDAGFAPHRRIAAVAGFRAVQSTPLFSRSGEPLGMLSTHFGQPHSPSESELRLTDLYARHAEEMIERKRTEEALRASYNELQRLNEELQVTNDELEETTEELESSRNELQSVNEELQARVAEVSLTNSDLRNLMASTDIGTIFLDRELCIKRYTPQIEKLFNVLPSDINRPLAHLTHRLDHTNLQEDARQVLADLQTVEREVHSRDDHWYIVRLLPYRTEEDKIDGVVVTFVEITERKRTEADLQKAQAELTHVARVTTLGEMTASIAHEVNQPLAAIVTNGDACLRLLARDKADLAGVREAVEAMISDALRASEVIKRIRTLLKKTASEKTWLDINATIREVIQMAANELDKNQIELRTQLAAGLQPALGDCVQLQQVILNLILNGNDAMSKTGWQPRELLISSQTRQPEEVMVAVRDSGTGLKPQDAERIFEPFFTTKEGGLGLGLSISRTIIEAHGGRLWATANEGQGTTLHFTLPTYSESIT